MTNTVTTSNTLNENGKRFAPFRDAVASDLATANKMQLGENGCPEYTDAGLGSQILALSQLVRGGDPSGLVDEALSGGASTQDAVDLMTLIFVTRNTRGGKGEKDLSFDMFLHTCKHYPITTKKLLRLFPHYGYWKDLLLLAQKAPGMKDTSLKEVLLTESICIMRTQFQKDLAAVAKYEENLASAGGEDAKELKKKGPSISLLSKWMPREGSHFDKKLNFVDQFTSRETGEDWKFSSKASYRKAVSKLTSYLQLPEVLLSAQRADEMNLGKLASRATHKLTRALLNETKDGQPRSEDPKRIRLAEMFLDHLTQKGLKGSQLMPHEIVAEIRKGRTISVSREKVLDAQWKDLWKNVVEQVKAKAEEEGLELDPTRMVPLSDVSGSMWGVPMEVSIALGIGLSEITHPAFQNMVLTFESKPRWHKLNAGDSIVRKVRSLEAAPWGGSTNFEGAYDCILDVCRRHKLAKEDVPSLIVFSDMQFNQANYGHSTQTMHDVLSQKFAKTGKSLGWSDLAPTPIVFWNLRNTGGHPVDKDTEGAVLLSGFSPSLLKLVMNGEALKEEQVEVVDTNGEVRNEKVRVTPEEVLRKMLNDSLYNPVRLVLAESNEGALGDYEPDGFSAVSAPEEEMEQKVFEEGGFEVVF